MPSVPAEPAQGPVGARPARLAVGPDGPTAQHHPTRQHRPEEPT